MASITTLGDIVKAELDAHGAMPGNGRVLVAGPPVALSGSAVQTLTLAIHELALNALQCGALAVERSCYVGSMLQRTPRAGKVIFWWVGRKIVHHGGKLHLPRVVAPQVQANAVPRERCVSELVFDVSSGNGLIAQAAYGAVFITRKEGTSSTRSR